jgi:hypothetical protein
MAKARHPAHAHIQRAKAMMQDHHDKIQGMLDQVAQSLPQDGEQVPGKPMAPTGPATGVTPPGGMSPLGGAARG